MNRAYASIRSAMKGLLPPFVARMLKDICSGSPTVEWRGPYSSWEEASDKCSKYNSDEIFQKVLEATREVVAEKSVYERDSCLFNQIEYSWPVLTSLLWIYAKDGHLNCIDFGGSLGSTYRQNNKFLDAFTNVQWNIVEQPHFVEAGKREFETNRLKFKRSMEEVQSPNVILFLNSLSYLENPWSFLKEATQQGSQYLMLDRTPFRKQAGDEVYMQVVRPPIYRATYPCRVFSQFEFELHMIELGWVCHERWVSELQSSEDWRYLGYLFVRNF